MSDIRIDGYSALLSPTFIAEEFPVVSTAN